MFITEAGKFDLLWLSNCGSLANIYCITHTHHCHLVRFNYHHLYGQVYRWCQAYSVELFIHGICSVFQAARSKINGGARTSLPFAQPEARRVSMRRWTFGGIHTLSVILFEEQLSTTRLIFNIWIVLSSIMTTTFVQAKIWICTLNSLNVAPDLTEHWNTDGKKPNWQTEATCCGCEADSQPSYGWAWVCREENKTHILSVIGGRAVRHCV